MDTEDKSAPVPGPAKRPRLNRHERRAAEKLLQKPEFVAQAKLIELRAVEAALHYQYMIEAIEEVHGSPLD